VSLVDQMSFELGVIHYASDTPYSRRQSLLSKSLSYFGMESTYGAAAAIAQRIFKNEIARLRDRRWDGRRRRDHRYGRDRGGRIGPGLCHWWRELHPGADVVVLEAAPEPGGYCRTVVQDGFVWDYSGHFFHFKQPAIEAWLRARMPGQDVRTVLRKSGHPLRRAAISTFRFKPTSTSCRTKSSSSAWSSCTSGPPVANRRNRSVRC